MKELFLQGATGNKIYIRQSGINKKGQIVLIHGIGLNSSAWKGLERGLARQYECFSIDLRGHGNSKNNASTVTFTDLSNDCYQVIKDLKIVNPIFIGHSLGGVVVLNLLMNTNLSTAPAVLISALFKSPFAKMEDVPLFHSLKYKAMFAGASVSFFTKAMSKYITQKDSKSLDLWRELRQIDLVMLLKVLKSMLGFNFTENLSEIKNRVLLIYGSRDPLVPERERIELSYKIRSSRVFVVEDAFHTPQFEKPKTVAEEVMKFISEKV